jgi:hypothetical protein
MSIYKEPCGGFTAARLDTENGAELHARYVNDGDNTFIVGTREADIAGKKRGTVRAWYFDLEACKEAAQFFSELAGELKRRGAE